MNQFSIKDLEHLSGIKAHTIRIWEQRYSFLQPQRTETNIRYYNGDQLKLLLNISLLNKFGFKISHIDKMSADEMQQKILSIASTEGQEDAIINQLIQNMIDLNLVSFEKLLNKVILEKGMEKATMHIIFPFLERIGLLWLTNHVHPAQEHLVSNIIRQKLLVAIDQLPPAEKSAQSILMFLPEGELHEIGLLFMSYLLRLKKFDIVYVGADIPLKDVVAITQAKNIDCIYTHLTAVIKKFPVERFLLQIHSQLHQIPCIVSGNLILSYYKSTPANIFLGRSLKESLQQVEQVCLKN